MQEVYFSGIQQIGIGVGHVQDAFAWYRKHFGMDIPVFDEAAEAGLMLPYTGGIPRSRHAILALNLQGGGGMEIWQYKDRSPEPPAFQPRLGDLGIVACVLKCSSVPDAFDRLRGLGVQVLVNPAIRPDGRAHFFVKDPWGNIFELVESHDWFQCLGRKAPVGGVYGAVIGVSDMDKSIAFYGDVLGYDIKAYDETGYFDDWHGLPGGEGQFRRVLLSRSQRLRGAFSALLGPSALELVQAKSFEPRRIFERRMWGDLGYIHLCFDITGMQTLKQRCADLGHPFTVDSSGSFDMGEAAGYFSYIEDPDGTLIEFVETHKVPILKKLNWYLDLRKRKNPERPLPGWMIKAMGFGRIRD